VQLGFQLAHTAALEEGQKQIEAGVSEYVDLVQKGARPDTVRDLAQSRLRLGLVQAVRGDFDGARKTFELARNALAPLAKTDPQNMTFRVDVLSIDFEFARLLVLERRFRDAETAIAVVIAAFEALHEEEDSGPGMGVMYAWLGEAQFGAGKLDQALRSLQKSAQLLESDMQYSDGICGIITDYVRIGDVLVKLERRSEAETAFRTAFARSDPALAAKRADLSALAPIAAAHAEIAHLRFSFASTARDPAQRDRLQAQACEEYHQAHEVNQLIPVAWTFNPGNFPVVYRKEANPPPECNHVALR
jgi:tetratricopeptide (TPR) repeat protein